jgi:hypothetical protein
MMDRRRVPGEADVELLWAASAPAPDVDRVRELAARADVSYVLATAAEQRVAPLVLRALRDADVDVRSEDSAAASIWQAHGLLAVPRAARAALEPLHEAGLDPLLLKGIALIERYPAPGLRPMDDIDVLVPPEHFDAAVRALEGAGWRRGGHVTGDLGYDVPFVHPSATDVPLELHYGLYPRERPTAFTAEYLWSTRRRTSVFGIPAWTLPVELEIVALVSHAAKSFHVFDRLLWSVDLAVITQTAEVDWEVVDRISSDARRRIATAIGLTLARRLGAVVPEELTHVPRSLGRSGAVAFLTDPVRTFGREAKDKTPWLAYALIDDFRGMAHLAIGDLREPPWGKGRFRVMREIGGLVARGAGGFIRAKSAARRPTG